MGFNILTVIILVTVVVSIAAFNNKEMLGKYMFIPYDVKHYGNKLRIFSHVLIHADWAHLIFNMFSLYFLGRLLLLEFQWEFGEWNGQAHFLALYVLGGLFATVIPYARHHDNPSYRSLGASGAVSAVIFAFILWNPTMNLSLMFIPIPIPAFVFGPLYLLFEFYMDKRGGSGIAHDAHIGGAIFGIIYALIINIDKGKLFIDQIFGL